MKPAGFELFRFYFLEILKMLPIPGIREPRFEISSAPSVPILMIDDVLECVAVGLRLNSNSQFFINFGRN